MDVVYPGICSSSWFNSLIELSARPGHSPLESSLAWPGLAWSRAAAVFTCLTAGDATNDVANDRINAPSSSTTAFGLRCQMAPVRSRPLFGRSFGAVINPKTMKRAHDSCSQQTGALYADCRRLGCSFLRSFNNNNNNIRRRRLLAELTSQLQVIQ